jgi:predicted nuclease with TOPRIM domain
MNADIDANDEKYREAFETSVQELSALINEREELETMRELLERRIEKLRHAIVGLGGLCGETAETINSKWPDLFPDKVQEITGLTDAIREILSSHAEHYLSPVHVRDLLKEMGFDTGKYKNVLASIHTVLKRLLGQGEVLDSSDEGRVVYRWNNKVELAEEEERY